MARDKKDDQQVNRRLYFAESRRLSLSAVFLLPLMALYHVGIVQSGASMRNMAETWMTDLLGMAGVSAAQVLNIVLVGALVIALVKLEDGPSLHFRFLFLMLIESVIYAFAMFQGLELVTTAIQRSASELMALRPANWVPLSLAAGAGVYEELVFRFLFIGGGLLVLTKFAKWNRFISLAVLLFLSSVIFSAIHYVGPFGDEPDTFSFLFRALAGVTLGFIYITRGLGIAAWTHALYNIFVLMSQQ